MCLKQQKQKRDNGVFFPFSCLPNFVCYLIITYNVCVPFLSSFVFCIYQLSTLLNNFYLFLPSTVNHVTQCLVELCGMLPDEAGVSNHAEQTGCSFDTNITGFRVKIAVILSLLWHKSTLRIVCFVLFFVFLLRVCLQVDQINYYYVMQVQLRESLARYIFLKKVLPF